MGIWGKPGDESRCDGGNHELSVLGAQDRREGKWNQTFKGLAAAWYDMSKDNV